MFRGDKSRTSSRNFVKKKESTPLNGNSSEFEKMEGQQKC